MTSALRMSDRAMEHDDVRRRFGELSDHQQLCILTAFSVNLTIVARDTYVVGELGIHAPERIRAINEIQHRVLGHILAMVTQADSRYPNDVLLSILLDHDDEHLRAGTLWALEDAMKSPRCVGERHMDVYQKLRPWTEIEACQCASIEGLLLLDSLTDNPLHCSVCLREVDPQRVQLTADETEAVATWFSAANALYRLWLHSGEYEAFAKARLTDPAGQVNRDGLQVARQLSARVPTRLVFFRDTDDAEPTQCPVCDAPLTTSVRRGVGECPSCPLLI